MRAIFISYRRDDSEGQAGRLFKDLVTQFGAGSVFMDVAGIEPGRDFRRVIDHQVASCGVLLAMIGKDWLDARDGNGQRRLDDPGDFVRLETATALKRDIPVIPVLVHGAGMPRAEQLPADLADLAYRNGVELTHARWDSDVQVLIKALRPYVEADGQPAAGPAPSTPAESDAAPAPQPAWTTPAAPAPAAKKAPLGLIAAAIATLVLAVGGYLAWDAASTSAQQQAEAQRLQAEAAAVRARAETETERARAEAAQAQAQAEQARAEAAAAREEAERVAAARAQAAAAQAEAERVARAKTLEAERLAQEREAERQARARAEAAAKAEAAARAEAARAETARAETPPPAQSVKLRGTISTSDPCTGRPVVARGTTSLAVRPTPTGGVMVYEQFKGAGDGYEVAYSGRKEFSRQASSYDIAIRGEWIGGSQRFKSAGVDRIFTDDAGAPSGDSIQRLENACAR